MEKTITYEQYLNEFNKRFKTWTGSKEGLAEQMELDYIDKNISLGKHVERHRKYSGKSWTYDEEEKV